MRSGGKPRRRPAGETVQTPPSLEPVAADDQPGTQLPLGPMEEPAEILVRFSTDEPDAAAEQVAGSPAPDEAVADRPSTGETAAEPPVPEEAAAQQVAKSPAESLAEPVAAQHFEGTVASSSEEPSAYGLEEPGPVEDASLLLRLARIHLRTGSLTTARAQLESLAGRNQLDTAGTLDLAEARWRTGDLQGAGDAAGAYLAANGGEALGLVIAAEAASLGIHEAEARGYMEQARLRTLTSFDAIFAGMPRRSKLTESERERIAGLEQIPVTESPKAVAPAAQPVATATVVADPEPKVAAETAQPQPVATVAEPQPVATVAEPQPEPVATVAEPQPEPVATVVTFAAEPEPQPVATVAEPQPVATAVAQPQPEPVATVAEPAAQPVVTFAAEPEPAAEAGLIVAALEAEPEPTPTVPVAGIAGTPGTGPSMADQAAQPVVDPSRAQADTEIAAGIALLETGDALLAALHFGIALRMTPESAQTVLGAIGDRHDLALELVRGDALRMQGHEHDAGQAYQSVASALSGARAAAEPPAKTPTGPAEAVAEVPAEAVAEVPAEPPGPLPVDAAADVPAERGAGSLTETPPEAESPESRPPEPAPPISWLD